MIQWALAWCCPLTFELADTDSLVPSRNSELVKVRRALDYDI